MSFSQAVKGTLSRGGIEREIDSQSEIELGHQLTPAEKTSFFVKFSPEIVLSRIEQVLFNKCIVPSINILILVWIWCSKVSVVSLQAT